MLDETKGRPRSIIPDIEKAAGLCTREGPLRFEELRLLDRASAGESEAGGYSLPSGRAAA
jgi:hypothetical protein